MPSTTSADARRRAFLWTGSLRAVLWRDTTHGEVTAEGTTNHTTAPMVRRLGLLVNRASLWLTRHYDGYAQRHLRSNQHRFSLCERSVGTPLPVTSLSVRPVGRRWLISQEVARLSQLSHMYAHTFQRLYLSGRWSLASRQDCAPSDAPLSVDRFFLWVSQVSGSFASICRTWASLFTIRLCSHCCIHQTPGV